MLFCNLVRFLLSATPDIWSSIVAGRKPSFGDANFPKPKHVPGTTMTLHTATPLYPWQPTGSSGATQNMKKSVTTPVLLSSGSYQSPGQVSPGQQLFPWHHQNEGQISAQNLGQGHPHGNHSPGEVLVSSYYSQQRESIPEDKDYNVSQKTDQLKGKVTFSLTDSSSSKSTESGFSENVCRPNETYASVCCKCQAAMGDSRGPGRPNHKPGNWEWGQRGKNHDSEKFRAKDEICTGDCSKSATDHEDQNKDLDHRHLQERKWHSGQGRDHNSGHWRGHNSGQNPRHQDRRYKDEGHYYHKSGHFHQGQGHSNRRGHRGGYRGNRGHRRDFYHQRDLESEKGHRSEPLLEAKCQDKRQIRRAVSSPDKVFDKSHTEFSYTVDDTENGSSKDETLGEIAEENQSKGKVKGGNSKSSNRLKLNTPQSFVEAEGNSPSSGDSEETQWVNVEHKSSRKRRDSENSRDGISHPQRGQFRGNFRGHLRGRGSRSMEREDRRFRDQYRARSHSDRDGYFRGRGRGEGHSSYRGHGPRGEN